MAFLVLLFLMGAVFGNKPKVVEEIRARRFLVIGVNDEITGRLGPEGLTLDETAANIILTNRRKADSVGLPPPVLPYIKLAGPTGLIELYLGTLPYKDHPEFGPSISIRDKKAKILWAAP